MEDPMTTVEQRALLLWAKKGLRPLIPFPGGKRPWPSIHEACGREVSPRYDNIRYRPDTTGCRYCAGNVEITEEEALLILKEADLEPLVPYPGSSQVAWPCRCLRCGSEDCLPRLTQVKRNRGRGCTTCGHVQAAAIRRARSEERMRAGLIEAGAEPTGEYHGVLKPWECRCLGCGKTITPIPGNVVIHGQGPCKHCAGMYVDPEEARAVMLAVNLDPIGDYPGTNVHWPSRCVVCHRVNHTVRLTSSRKGHGCKYCFHARIGDINRLPEDEAVALATECGYEPLEPYRGSDIPWLCRCLTCGRETTPLTTNMRKKNRCKYCATHGFWKCKLALVYLLVHEEFGAVKIGVGKDGGDRVSKHARHGWTVLELWGGLTPQRAWDAEQMVLELWRSLQIPHGVTREQMPQFGWTETAPLAMVDVEELVALISRTLKRRPKTCEGDA
jgi:hypothetical protein